MKNKREQPKRQKATEAIGVPEQRPEEICDIEHYVTPRLMEEMEQLLMAEYHHEAVGSEMMHAWEQLLETMYDYEIIRRVVPYSPDAAFTEEYEKIKRACTEKIVLNTIDDGDISAPGILHVMNNAMQLIVVDPETRSRLHFAKSAIDTAVEEMKGKDFYEGGDLVNETMALAVVAPSRRSDAPLPDEAIEYLHTHSAQLKEDYWLYFRGGHGLADLLVGMRLLYPDKEIMDDNLWGALQLALEDPDEERHGYINLVRALCVLKSPDARITPDGELRLANYLRNTVKTPPPLPQRSAL